MAIRALMLALCFLTLNILSSFAVHADPIDSLTEQAVSTSSATPSGEAELPATDTGDTLESQASESSPEIDDISDISVDNHSCLPTLSPPTDWNLLGSFQSDGMVWYDFYQPIEENQVPVALDYMLRIGCRIESLPSAMDSQSSMESMDSESLRVVNEGDKTYGLVLEQAESTSAQSDSPVIVSSHVSRSDGLKDIVKVFVRSSNQIATALDLLESIVRGSGESASSQDNAHRFNSERIQSLNADYGFLDSLRLPWRSGDHEPRKLTQDWIGHSAFGFALDFGHELGGIHVNGTELVAPAAGRACFQYDYSSTYGNYVDIDVRNGWTIRLAHMLDSQSGCREVEAGDLVGRLGGTPNWVPHIHVELLLGGGRPDYNSIQRVFGHPRDDFRYTSNPPKYFTAGASRSSDPQQDASITPSGTLERGQKVYFNIRIKNHGTVATPAIHPYIEGRTPNGNRWAADGSQPASAVIQPGQSVTFQINHDLWMSGTWTANSPGVFIWNNSTNSYWKPLPANGNSQNISFTVREPQPSSSCLAQSAHPYGNNFNSVWTITNPDSNATSTRIRFSRIETEPGYDIVTVADGNNRVVNRVTGNYSNVYSAVVSGRTVRVQLQTDGSVTHWGFCVDRIETVSSGGSNPTPPPSNPTCPAPSGLISSVRAATGKAYALTNLATNAQYYIDRSFVLRTVPSTQFPCAKLIKTANDSADQRSTSSNFLSFNLSSSADVYVGYDRRSSRVPDWLRSFTDTGLTVSVSDSDMAHFKLYRRRFNAGTVYLGGNWAQGSDQAARSMYIVMVQR